MVASCLHLSELGLVMEFMKNVKMKRESYPFPNDLNEDVINVTETSDVSKTDNESNDSPNQNKLNWNQLKIRILEPPKKNILRKYPNLSKGGGD